MKLSDIKVGETYLFVATDSPARKSLEGQPFTVTEIKSVWRRNKLRSARMKRVFNEDGVGARPEELEPISEREFPCNQCMIGQYEQVGYVTPSGQVNYECDQCGDRVSFP